MGLCPVSLAVFQLLNDYCATNSSKICHLNYKHSNLFYEK